MPAKTQSSDTNPIAPTGAPAPLALEDGTQRAHPFSMSYLRGIDPGRDRGLRRVSPRIASPDHLVRLWPLLALYDVELHIVAFLEALISVHLNRAVMNEHIGSVVPSYEPVTLGVVKPLHFASVLSHVPNLPLGQ